MKIYRQDPRAASRNIRGEAAIIPPQERRIVILNEMGTEIWALCENEGCSLENLCESLSERFDASQSTIMNETLSFIEELVETGALIASE